MLGFGLTTAGLITLIKLNPTHFTSVDSGYYLQSAANLMGGRGYVVNEDGRWVWNGTFPIGYPALIAAGAGLTGLPVLWASKLINMMALVLSAGLWVRRVGPERSLWLLSIWWLGGFLRILAYTWSETVFLVLLAEWVWVLSVFLQASTLRGAMWLALLSLGLFSIRYVGGYVVGLMTLLSLAIYLIPSRTASLLSITVRPRTAGLLLIIAAICLIGMGAYGWLNHQLSGSPWGGERFAPTESTRSLLTLFIQSIGNELLLIRDFLPNGDNGLAWFGVFIQLILMLLLCWRLSQKSSPERQPITPDQLSNSAPVSTLSRLFIGVGGVYVLVLFGLRIFSPFSGPNARLMAPITFCVLMATLLWIGTTPNDWQRKLRLYWLALLVCSWLQLLPQVNFTAKMALVRDLLSVY
ncbi:MAG: hypothetical protein JWP57_2827 [Spirosoma sp.]|nr:hypothetical protein [Spirosoma sp.]